MRESRGGQQQKASVRRRTGVGRGLGEALEAPSLAELRRRATHRLREIGARLEELKQERDRAAAECARLQAANGAAKLEELPPAVRPKPGPRPAPVETIQEADLSGGEEERDTRCTLESRLTDVEASLERERGSKAELEQRLSCLESNLEKERSAHRVTAEDRDRLKAGLRHAERRLAEQSQRAEAMEARAEQLQAELETARQTPEPEGDSADEWQQHILQLQLDLRSALDDRAEACEKLDSLVRFLDELNEVLGRPAAGPE